MQIDSSTSRSFSIPGLPTETAPITKAIDLNCCGVPIGEKSWTYSRMLLRTALELVPISLVPRGNLSLTSFLMTYRSIAEPVAALTLSLVRHCAIMAAKALYVRGTRSIGETSISALLCVLM
jgi:hypothetical protein